MRREVEEKGRRKKVNRRNSLTVTWSTKREDRRRKERKRRRRKEMRRGEE